MFSGNSSCRKKKYDYICKTNGVLAHLVERNTGSVEVSGSSPLCSTKILAESMDVGLYFF